MQRNSASIIAQQKHPPWYPETHEFGWKMTGLSSSLASESKACVAIAPPTPVPVLVAEVLTALLLLNKWPLVDT